jgi:glyoxylase-like metal-dependent hydrolase (beta-lactamase superfamily II)
MRHACFVLAACAAFLFVDQKPEWCRNLPRPAYSRLERVSVKDTWFEVYRIRPGVFAIYEPRQSEEVISYLILGRKKALLFDTGMGISNIRAVVQELTQLPVAVLNSHTHNDHVGDNWRFSEIYGRDTEFTREHARGSSEAAQAELAPGELCGPLPAGFDRKSYRTRPFTITHWLRGGEKISLGGRVLQVISTPGHTPDSIMLFDEANGLLFTGDMYYPGPIFLFRPETDLDAYVASVRAMAALAPHLQLLLPAHNLPVAEPGELNRVLAAMEQVRSGKVEAAPHGESWEYRFEGFSFLMQKQTPGPKP